MFLKILNVSIIGIIIGTIVACSVQIFLFLIDFFSSFFKDENLIFESQNLLNFINLNFFVFIIIIPTLIGFLVGKLRNFAQGKRWHGPPDVILSVHTKNNPLDIKTGFLQYFLFQLVVQLDSMVHWYILVLQLELI